MAPFHLHSDLASNEGVDASAQYRRIVRFDTDTVVGFQFVGSRQQFVRSPLVLVRTNVDGNLFRNLACGLKYDESLTVFGFRQSKLVRRAQVTNVSVHLWCMIVTRVDRYVRREVRRLDAFCGEARLRHFKANDIEMSKNNIDVVVLAQNGGNLFWAAAPRHPQLSVNDCGLV